jgi:hypothetical protein
MTHASLFSGIGGFDLAAEWAGWENVFHCEWNPFGQRVLKHHFPNSISYHDIKKTDFTIHANKIDILTGGFPCQPYSSAGKRLGKADERHLFPEMLRCIKEVKPRWIIGENVRGLVSWGGDWYSTRCVMTWKAKDMKSKRFLFQLQVSTRHTKDNEYGLLLTPTTKEVPQDLDKFKARMEKYPNGTTMPNLATQVMKLLPTPLAQCREQTNTDAYDKRMKRLVEKGHHPFTMPLDQMAIRGLLPTPTLQEYTNSTLPPSQMKRNNIAGHLLREGISAHSQLNPQFVGEMMGFPENWTELPFLNGATNPSKHTETQ